MKSGDYILAPVMLALGMSTPLMVQADNDGERHDDHEGRSRTASQGGETGPREVRLDTRLGTTAGGGAGGERSGVIVAPAALPVRQGFSGEIELLERKVQAAEATLQAIKDAHRAGRFYTTDGTMPVITVATTVTQTVVETPVIETNTPPPQPEPVYSGDGGGDGSSGAGDGGPD